MNNDYSVLLDCPQGTSRRKIADFLNRGWELLARSVTSVLDEEAQSLRRFYDHYGPKQAHIRRKPMRAGDF